MPDSDDASAIDRGGVDKDNSSAIDHGGLNNDNDNQRREFLFPYVRHKDMPWQKVIVPDYIKPFIVLKESEGEKPTVRGVLYYLESKRVLPKNDHTYDRIKTALSNARRGYKRIDGTRGPPTIPMDAFADNTRHIIKDFKDKERSLKDYISDGIAQFLKLPDNFQKLIPRWLDQNNYVEVWVEKDAKARSVQRALNGRHVVIAPHRGNPSITFIHENIERVVDEFLQHKREYVYILYLGDLDPVGWNMDRLIQQDLARQTRGITGHDGKPIRPRFVFKRIGITVEQIKRYRLSHLMHPDSETLAKLKSKGILAERFKREFGSLFQIELEAFDLIPFARFQSLLRQEVDKYFNQDIYKQVLARPEYSQKPSKIKEQIIDALNNLITELEI